MIQVGNRYKFIFQVHKILFKVNYFAKVEIQEQKKQIVCIKTYFRSVFACKKCKCLIHKSIQTLAYIRKFTYLSAIKHVKQ